MLGKTKCKMWTQKVPWYLLSGFKCVLYPKVNTAVIWLQVVVVIIVLINQTLLASFASIFDVAR